MWNCYIATKKWGVRGEGAGGNPIHIEDDEKVSAAIVQRVWPFWLCKGDIWPIQVTQYIMILEWLVGWSDGFHTGIIKIFQPQKLDKEGQNDFIHSFTDFIWVSIWPCWINIESLSNT